MDNDPARAIEQLKYRYVRTLDLKQWDAFAECLVPEATGDYAGLVFADRDALVGYLRENLGPGLISMHHVHHPEIEVDSDEVGAKAHGTWYLEDKVLAPEFGFVLEGAAFYADTYVRTPAGWRIEHTGYQRTYEASWRTTETPSFQVKIGTAYDAPA